MSLKPLFAAAPRIKIRVDNRVLGYAIGFNINVSVDVQPIYVVGQYEAVSLEPTMYNTVAGTMQIVRLMSGPTKNALKAQTAPVGPNSGQKAGNAKHADVSLANSAQTNVVGQTEASGTNNPLEQSKLFRHIDPRFILFSETFDVDVYMKVVTDAPTSSNSSLAFKEVSWLTIKNCRITSRNTNISMGQLVNEPLNFQGLIALPSGDQTNFALDNGVQQIRV